MKTENFHFTQQQSFPLVPRIFDPYNSNKYREEIIYREHKVKRAHLEGILTRDERIEQSIHLTDAIMIHCLAACKAISRELESTYVSRDVRNKGKWCYRTLLNYMREGRDEYTNIEVLSFSLGRLGEEIDTIKARMVITPHRNALRDKEVRASLKHLPL